MGMLISLATSAGSHIITGIGDAIVICIRRDGHTNVQYNNQECNTQEMATQTNRLSHQDQLNQSKSSYHIRQQRVTDIRYVDKSTFHPVHVPHSYVSDRQYMHDEVQFD